MVRSSWSSRLELEATVDPKRLALDKAVLEGESELFLGGGKEDDWEMFWGNFGHKPKAILR